MLLRFVMAVTASGTKLPYIHIIKRLAGAPIVPLPRLSPVPPGLLRFPAAPANRLERVYSSPRLEGRRIAEAPPFFCAAYPACRWLFAPMPLQAGAGWPERGMVRRIPSASSATVPPGFVRAAPVSRFFASLGKFYIRQPEAAPPIWGIHLRPKHGNRHGTGHGGFLATLMDTHMAGFIHYNFPNVRVVTTDLKLKYLRPARMGDWLEAHQVSVTREDGYATVVCDLKVGDATIARGTARFKLMPKA